MTKRSFIALPAVALLALAACESEPEFDEEMVAAANALAAEEAGKLPGDKPE